MNTSTPGIVIRPYTSYNLFFQLERQYILQTLGVQPQIAPAHIFHPVDARANYHGPPLPSRYANLILPYDWHIPGKTQRRKRSHRKSHGKIGFYELNNRISKAWAMVDDETRKFCVNLSDIESRKYKRVKKVPKKAVAQKKVSISTKAMVDSENDAASFDWTVDFPQDEFATDKSHSDKNSISVRPTIYRQVSLGSVNEKHHEDHSSRNHRGSLTEVDMADDEIIDIWKSIHIEDDRSIPFLLSVCQVCVEIPDANCSTIDTIQEEEDDSQKDDTRMSFIDAEYDMFKEIGKQFSTNKQNLPSMIMRKAFTARQA